jgi:hypothetical protein
MDTLTFNRLRLAISHALTMHDANERELAKKNKRRYWNPHALPLYYQALESWEADKRTAANPLATLPHYFTTVKDDGKTFSIRAINKAIAPFIE